MNLRALEYFVHLSESLSFTKTALYFRVSQPNISKQVLQLERDLETQLFVRDKRTVRLSDAGKRLRQTLKPRLQEIQEVLTHLKSDQRELTGQIRVGCLPEIGMNLFFQRFLAFQRRYPKIRLEVQYRIESEVLQGLREGLFDFGICTRGENTQTLRAYSIDQEQLALVGSIEMIDRLSRGEWRGREAPFVCYRREDPLVLHFLHIFRKKIPFKGISLRVIVNSHRSMSQALVSSTGFAIMPLASVAGEIKARRLQAFEGALREDPLYLLEPEQDFFPKRVLAFRDFVRKDSQDI